jgi:hypothetical protein
MHHEQTKEDKRQAALKARLTSLVNTRLQQSKQEMEIKRRIERDLEK